MYARKITKKYGRSFSRVSPQHTMRGSGTSTNYFKAAVKGKMGWDTVAAQRGVKWATKINLEVRWDLEEEEG